MYITIQKIALQAESETCFQIWFSPRFGGKKWRNSEHAHASYPGLSFRPPGSAPIWGVKKGEFRDWTKPQSKRVLFVTDHLNLTPVIGPSSSSRKQRKKPIKKKLTIRSFYLVPTRHNFSARNWASWYKYLLGGPFTIHFLEET